MERFLICLLVLLFACGPTSGLDKVEPPPPPPPPPVDAGVVVIATPSDAGLPKPIDAGHAPDAGEPPPPPPPPPPDAGMPPDNHTPDDCITDVSVGAHAFECDGITYHVSVPPRCASPGCGVIFDVHGFTMSGPMEENNTNLAALTQTTDFIVVQPSATPAPPRSNWSAFFDDDKVFDFMNRTMSVFRTNPGRLHITGFSDGGWLTWRFVCEHADVLASAAPAAASGYCSPERACDFTGREIPGREIPLFLMLGTADNYVEYVCAEEQVAAVVAAWSMTSEGEVERGDGYRVTRYGNQAGTTFETIVHDYATDVTVPLIPDLGGHCYPGSTDTGDEPGQLFSFACDPPNAFHWGERVLDFFQRTGAP